MRPGVVLALLAGCSLYRGSGDDVADDVPDARPVDAITGDARPSCGTRWTLVEREATALALIDGAPLNNERTARVAVTLELGPCEEIAMIELAWTLENEYAVLRPRVWSPVGGDCTDPPRTVVRPVPIRFAYPATWNVSVAGAPAIDVVVGAAPDRPCNPDLAVCGLDCDCDESAGQKCLGFDSLTGPTTACGRPCEVDRDCGGAGSCAGEIDDGLGHVCTDAPPECGAGAPCPVGWTCTGGACAPDFVLSSQTRGVCGCDADCAPGLRCVEAWDPAQPPRCQAICQTGGPWCEGPHWCAAMFQDVSGLAGTDSVCGWVGE
jgi:hypothetical protein